MFVCLLLSRQVTAQLNRGASRLRAVKCVSSFVLKTHTRIDRSGIQDYVTLAAGGNYARSISAAQVHPLISQLHPSSTADYKGLWSDTDSRPHEYNVHLHRRHLIIDRHSPSY